MSTFVRNQWYVAAYGREVGPGPARPDHPAASRSFCTAPSPAGSAALADRCVHRRFPLSARAQPRSSATPWSAATTASPTTPTGACVAVPGQTRMPRTARVAALPGRRAGLASSGSGSATPSGPIRPASPARPGWPTRTGPRSAAWSRSRPAATLLVDNLMDLSHETYLHGGYIGTPEVAEHPDHHRGRRGAADRAGQPAHGRRRVPAVLLHVDRHPGPDHPLAGHRVPPAVPVPAAQPDRAGRGAARPRRPGRPTPSTSRWSTRSPRPPRPRPTTSGPWPATSPWTTRRSASFLQDSNRTVVLQDVTALDLLETVIAAEPAGAQELSINIDTGALAARRMLAGWSGRADARVSGTGPRWAQLPARPGLRVDWVPGTDTLRGSCYCGATSTARGSGALLGTGCSATRAATSRCDDRLPRGHGRRGVPAVTATAGTARRDGGSCPDGSRRGRRR